LGGDVFVNELKNTPLGQPVIAAIPAASIQKPSSPATERRKLLLEGEILPTMLRLALQNVMNLLAFVGVIIFDGYFLGQIGTSALAGASLAFPFVMMVLHSTNSGMGAGVSSAIARAIGAGQHERAHKLVFHAFVLALALGAIFTSFMWLCGPVVFRWMGGQDEVLADALRYANIAMGGAVCICVLNLLGNVVRGTGNMRFHASVLLGCVVAHIALSPVLIFGWGPIPSMGSAGAAWSLILPFAVGSIVMVRYLRSGQSALRLEFRCIKLQRELFADILNIGVPSLINMLIMNLSILILTGIAGQFGPSVAIGYAMGARLEYILQPVVFGFGMAIVAMVGTNWGAGQYQRARKIAWTGAILSAGICTIIGSVVAIWPHLWVGLFSSDPEVLRIGSLYLQIVGPVYGCFGLALGLVFACQGYGRGLGAMVANGVRLLVNALGAWAAAYWLGFGLTGFCVAVAIGFAIYAALLSYNLQQIKDPITKEL
jgi:putative MATE family efflux protein